MDEARMKMKNVSSFALGHEVGKDILPIAIHRPGLQVEFFVGERT